MATVEIYTKSWCGYSKAALRLLNRKGVKYTHIDVTNDHEKELIMIQRANTHTVPQVFINGQSVGGYDDIAALDASGELNKLLAVEIPVTPYAQPIEGVQNEQLYNS